MRVPPFHWWRTVFYLIPAISIYTIVLGTASIVSSVFDRRGYFAHRCARLWSWLILATTGVDVEVEGLDRLQPGRTYVFVANHQSIYDIPILFWSLPYQLRIIAKESLGSIPFLGWHLRRTGHMLVDRRHPDRTRIFGWASRLMSSGLSLIVFPEGHRNTGDEIGAFKSGIFHLSRRRPDLELVPTYSARAITSGGTLGAADFNRISVEFLDSLRQVGELDGCYFSLHGAMAAETRKKLLDRAAAVRYHDKRTGVEFACAEQRRQ